MKKYLMSGVAALALCAAFTSCSKNEELFNPEQIKQNEIAQVYDGYNQAFIQTFGQPAANHDWGFKSFAGTRAENKNLNEWGDPAKNGGKAWDVPDALTPEQKLRVRLYFQYNPRLTYIAPNWTDFFVQQVYKGNPNTKGPNSAEEYYRVNGEKFTGSDEMDYLFCATEATHINDFNDGEWNNGQAVEVLNTGHSANEHQGNTTHVEGVTHPDQITLMVNSSAAYIGYGASTADGQFHKDCCALAGAKAIDDWADSDEAKALGLPSLGAPVYSERWNRSFVGLDYEGMKKADALSETSVKALDINEGGVTHVLYQGNFIKLEDFTDFVLTDRDGNEVKFLNDQVSNKSIGQKMKDAEGKDVTKSTFKKKGLRTDLEAQYNTTIVGNTDIWYYDLDLVMTYINDGCNPTSSDKNMIKNIGGRDYVYSDWIVTLTEAKKVDEEKPSENVIRIMAEDLNAKANKQENVIEDDSDWDFNDVVLDVTFLGNNQVKIVVVAAGGTLPLRINGEDALEVHGLFKQPTGIMINTCRTEASQRKYPNHYNTTILPEFTRTIAGVDADGGRGIKLEVEKTLSDGTTQWFEMTARRGNPAAKFAVKPTVDFCEERQHITSKYSMFGQWVENAGDLVWWLPQSSN